MTGTFINVATVLLGGLLGLLLGARVPERLKSTVVTGMGLFTAAIGLQMFLRTGNAIIVLGALLIGALLGEWWRIEDTLQSLGQRLEQRFGGNAEVPDASSRFVRGFLTTSLLFCVGPLTILGSIQDGLTGDFSLLAVKSVLDGFGALAFDDVFAQRFTSDGQKAGTEYRVNTYSSDVQSNPSVKAEADGDFKCWLRCPSSMIRWPIRVRIKTCNRLTPKMKTARSSRNTRLSSVSVLTSVARRPPSSRQARKRVGMPGDWLGGFLCPCHGSTFDFVGRVFKAKPAPTNLEVPPHVYLSDTRILIGEGKKGA